MKRTIAFIFARGGSKGLPLKNQLILKGHPMIAYSIHIAKINPNINEVYVSTDSNRIASIAKEYGAKVINRPEALAKDNSPEYLSWKHAIKEVYTKEGVFDIFISLPPTSPLRSLEDTQKCLKAFNENDETIITITPSSRSPWFNMVSMDNEKNLSILSKGDPITRRQESPKTYDITTVAYVAEPNFILSSASIWDKKVKGIIIPKDRALDIDDKYDFLIAEYFIKNRKDLMPKKL